RASRLPHPQRRGDFPRSPHAGGDRRLYRRLEPRAADSALGAVLFRTRRGRLHEAHLDPPIRAPSVSRTRPRPPPAGPGGRARGACPLGEDALQSAMTPTAIDVDPSVSPRTRSAPLLALGVFPSPNASSRCGEGLAMGALSRRGSRKQPPPPTPPHVASLRGRGADRVRRARFIPLQLASSANEEALDKCGCRAQGRPRRVNS